MAQDGAFYSKRLTEMQSDLTNFNPIDGLLAEPIVSLVTAVQMLQDKDPKMAKIKLLPRVTIALMFAEDLDSDKMSLDQAASIHLYTQESEIYKELNLRLRERDRNLLKPFFPYLKLFLSGLYKLPLINDPLYRGVKQNLSELYIQKRSKKIFFWAFTSASSSMEVLASPLFLGDSGQRTMHCITARSVDIRAFSAMPQEDERLIFPGTCLVVDGVLDVGNGLFTVQLHEAKDNPSGLIDFPHPGLIASLVNVCINLRYLSIVCVIFFLFSPFYFNISTPIPLHRYRSSHSDVLTPFYFYFSQAQKDDSAVIDLKAQVSKLKEESDALKAQVAAMQQASLTASVASLQQQGVAKKQIAPPTIAQGVAKQQIASPTTAATPAQLKELPFGDKSQGFEWKGRWYRGSHLNGKPHGWGRMDWSGSYCIEEWVDGALHGRSNTYYPDGRIMRERNFT